MGEKERKELQTKLKSQEKKVDFFERAKRIEEIPLLEKHLEVTKIANRDMWQQQEEDRIAQLLEERKVAMLHRDLLIRMRDDKVKFVEDLKAARLNSFTVKLSEFESEYENVRTERIKERKDKRREQRRIQWLNEKEEAEQKARDEELKRQREETERIEFERRQAELDELRKRKEAADLVLQKQREREREFRRGGGEDREIRRGGEDREIRRGGEDREIRRAPPAAREGESSWRSMRPAAGSDRPQ